MSKHYTFLSAAFMATLLFSTTAFAEWKNLEYVNTTTNTTRQSAFVGNESNVFSIRKHKDDVIAGLYMSKALFQSINKDIAIKYTIDNGDVIDLEFAKRVVDVGALGQEYYSVSNRENAISWKIDPERKTRGKNPDGEFISSKIPSLIGIQPSSKLLTIQLQSNSGEIISLSFDLVNSIEKISKIY